MKTYRCFSLILAYFLVACSSIVTPIVAPTLSEPTYTSIPTRTKTPVPTETLTPSASPTPYSLPGPLIPDSLGVSIHFFSDGVQGLSLLPNVGFSFVRTDIGWAVVESSKGIYDFSAYAPLVDYMYTRGIRIVFILDYGNSLYDDGLAPFTDSGRTAFARFSAAAAKHYARKGILWEIWNEPNLDKFWKPKSNVQDYAKLAIQAIKAIRQADPDAIIVGPSVCCFGEQSSWRYIEDLGELGVLGKFDAVTIHPYSYPIPKPEEVETIYSHLRQMLEKYSPNRKVPIIAGEQGYSTSWGISETQQAEYLVRAWLTNLADGVALSIWYDWKNDCLDKSNAECNFGMIDYQFSPKPAYLAAQTLTHTLDGYQFERRVTASNSNDYVYLFKKDKEAILVLWTLSANHSISLPLTGSLSVVSMLGERSILTSGENVLTVQLNSSPQYIQVGTQEIP